MNKTLLSLSVMAVLGSSPLWATQVWAAQEAPTPRHAPRIPVQRQIISERKQEAPPRQVSGTVTIVDTERLRIGGYDVRLFGVVPPQISASYGVQARAALDNLTAGGAVTCSIIDRAKDGRLLAQCRNSKNTDIALDLLRRGLAVAARGSLGEGNLAAPYIEAEQAAQAQKLGLWSLVVPEAASVVSKPKQETEKAEVEKSGADKLVAPPVPDAKPEIKSEAKTEMRAEAKPALIPLPLPAIAASAVNPAPSLAAGQSTQAQSVGMQAAGVLEWMQRLQFLLATLVASFTAFGVMGLYLWQKKRDRRFETSELAAALRGELMAARAIALGRLRECAAAADDAAVAWPRLRATLYQASVGRIGLLGADLARQVSSIYGQAHDYAAFYNNVDAERAASTPKRHALQTLIHYIEAVLPRLERLEKKSTRLPALHALPEVSAVVGRVKSALPELPRKQPKNIATAEHANSAIAAPSPTPLAQNAEKVTEPKVAQFVAPLSVIAVSEEAKPIAAVAPVEAVQIAEPEQKMAMPEKNVLSKRLTAAKQDSAQQELAQQDKAAIKSDELAQSHSQAQSKAQNGVEKPAPSPLAAEPAVSIVPKPEKGEVTSTETPKPETVQSDTAKTETPKSETGTKPALIAPLWVAVREFAQERFSSASSRDATEDPVTDYARMIEEEMATLGVYDLDDDGDDDTEHTLLKRMRG